MALIHVEKVTYLKVNAAAGQRIDNYLFTNLKGVPKSKIYKILRSGEIRVNKGRVKPCYRLCHDDEIRIPPLRRPDTTQTQVPANYAQRYDLEQAVIFENDDLLILNKPAGLAVHGGSGISFGLIELLRSRYPNSGFLELVHRLDKDTSGCIMIAKSRKMLKALHELLRDGKVSKIYHTLVSGFAPPKFNVSSPLKKFELQSGERMVKMHPDGQPAFTKFKTLQRFPGLSLLEAMPITGRTHQIRVHAAGRQLPIIADQKYGNKMINTKFRASGFTNLCLHAHQLKFTCPISGQDINVTAEYDPKFAAALAKLANLGE